jgi:hypothetical protein
VPGVGVVRARELGFGQTELGLPKHPPPWQGEWKIGYGPCMSWWRKRPASVLAGALVLAACIERPLPTDAVRDESQAIEIAKSACGEGYQPPGRRWRWHATLHEGEWYVWLGVLSQPKIAPLSADIRASDGYVWDGREYVPALPLRAGHGSGCSVGINDNGYPEPQ